MTEVSKIKEFLKREVVDLNHGEINYKRETHKHWVSLLNGRTYLSIVRTNLDEAIDILVKALRYKNFNLIDFRERDNLVELLKEKEVALKILTALGKLLDAGFDEDLLKDYFQTLEMFRASPRNAISWRNATSILIVANPEIYPFFKYTEITRAFEHFGFTFNYSSTLSLDIYLRLREGYEYISKFLLEEIEFKVNDYIDVQSVIFILGNNYNNVHRILANKETDDKVSSKRKPSESNLNTIFYGPPGTGKTYTTQQDYINQSENSRFITFHQSYSYEDFVEGIKPDLAKGSNSLGFKIIDGIFKEACQEAYKLAREFNPSSQHEKLADFIEASSVEQRNEFFRGAPAYTLCIDEINRGNVSAIFGELITLIEESKRLGKASEAVISLPYSHKKFGVPPNLQIIGTMNTADRSVEALDTALRRRFVFKEMMPKYEDHDFKGDNRFHTVNKIHMGHVLKVINQRIEVLLDRDHMIGHTYLLNKKSHQAIKDAFENQIIPLLQEYFYNDYQKIAMVLGEGFIKRETSQNLDSLFAFKSEMQHSLNAERWSIVTLDDSFDLHSALKQLMCIKDDTPSESSP